ncbi:unnamed protein product, partial [Ixodes persulcatus]
QTSKQFPDNIIILRSIFQPDAIAFRFEVKRAASDSETTKPGTWTESGDVLAAAIS